MPNWDNTELLRLLNAHYIRLPANFGVRVYNSPFFLHNNSGNFVTVTFDTEFVDTGITNDYADGFWDVGNAGRLTATKSGFYIIDGNAWFQSDNVGYRAVTIRDVGNAVSLASHSQNAVQNAATRMSISTVSWLNAGDYVSLLIYQDSGGNLTVNGPAGDGPEFGMVRIP